MPKRMSARRAGPIPCAMFCSWSFAVVEQNAVDGCLTAGREVISGESKDLTAWVIPEEDEIGELGNRGRAIDIHPGCGRTALQ